MSGAFNYPREEHHVVLNVDDVVEVSWWSDFANMLVVDCYEAGDIAGQSERFNIAIEQNGTEPWSPVYLSRRFDDWTLPAGCELALSKEGGGFIGGATIGVTSAASQSASILALSSTVPWDTQTTPSAPPTPITTSILSSVSTTSSTLPIAPPTAPVISSGSSIDVESSSGLSTGAKAGIGAGLGVGALLVVVGAYLLYRKRRSARTSEATGSYQHEAQQYEKPIGVSIAHHPGDGHNKPYNDATTWPQEQQPPQVPISELAATR
ncbi:hypothetical protein ACET3X_010021 [Alternaria dauci]|uniref:Mid2 domain-containing protein n=1 Tax=Alternaria dauci TaxID=48095 RepID=A0ABR3U6Y9_9PLEO